MKSSGIRWLFIVGVVGAGFAGVISSNIGCGSDDGGKAGSGGSSGGGTSGGGTSGGGTSGGKAGGLSCPLPTTAKAGASRPSAFCGHPRSGDMHQLEAQSPCPALACTQRARSAP